MRNCLIQTNSSSSLVGWLVNDIHWMSLPWWTASFHGEYGHHPDQSLFKNPLRSKEPPRPIIFTTKQPNRNVFAMMDSKFPWWMWCGRQQCKASGNVLYSAPPQLNCLPPTLLPNLPFNEQKSQKISAVIGQSRSILDSHWLNVGTQLTQIVAHHLTKSHTSFLSVLPNTCVCPFKNTFRNILLDVDDCCSQDYTEICEMF